MPELSRPEEAKWAGLEKRWDCFGKVGVFSQHRGDGIGMLLECSIVFQLFGQFVPVEGSRRNSWGRVCQSQAAGWNRRRTVEHS